MGGLGVPSPLGGVAPLLWGVGASEGGCRCRLLWALDLACCDPHPILSIQAFIVLPSLRPGEVSPGNGISVSLDEGNRSVSIVSVSVGVVALILNGSSRNTFVSNSSDWPSPSFAIRNNGPGCTRFSVGAYLSASTVERVSGGADVESYVAQFSGFAKGSAYQLLVGEFRLNGALR